MHHAGANHLPVTHPDRRQIGARWHVGWHMYCVTCAKAPAGAGEPGVQWRSQGHTDEGVCTCGFKTSKPQGVGAFFCDFPWGLR